MKKVNKKIGIELNKGHVKVVAQRMDGVILKETLPVDREKSIHEYFDALHEFFSSFTKKHGIKSGKLRFTISADSDFGVMKSLSLPLMDKKSLEKAIRYELEDQEILPKVDEYVVKWTKTLEDIENSQINIMVFVVRKDVISELSRFKKIFWDVESVEMYPSTMGRFIKKNSVVIDYSYRETFLYFYTNGYLQDVTVIPSGEKRVEDIISEISPEYSETEMKNLRERLQEGDKQEETFVVSSYQDNSSFNTEDLSEYEEDIDKDVLMEAEMMINQEIEYITQESKRMIRQFEVRNNISVENVYYLGEFGQTTSSLDLFKTGITTESKSIEEVLSLELDIENMIYGLSAAAFSNEFADYMKDLNFFKDIKNSADMKSILAAVLITGILLYGGIMVVNSRYESRINEIEGIQKEQQLTLSKIGGEVAKMRKEVEDNKQFIDAIGMIGQERIWMADFLGQLAESTPSGVVIQKMMIQDGEILLRGESTDYSNIGLLSMEMEKIGEVIIDYMDKPSLNSVNIINPEKSEKHSSSIAFAMKIKADFPTSSMK